VVEVLQTIGLPVLETPVAPATVQIALGVTVGFAVADVVVFVGVGVVVVVVVVEGLGVVGCGVVDVFAGSVAVVVGAFVGSGALVVGALVGSAFGAPGIAVADVLLRSVVADCAVGTG
jgi:hypothetical protein